MQPVTNDELKKICQRSRRLIMEMIFRAGNGHVGGALSSVEAIAVLYYRVMKIDPKNPRWEERDRFILSKGHAGPALYSILAMKGFFPEEVLLTLNKGGTLIPSHVDMNKTPGIDMTAGALGQGLSAGVGMALAAKLDKKSHRVFVMLGDGEINEGQVWEAAMTAAKYQLDNLTVIVDYNKMQIDGPCSEVMPVEPLNAKWTAFNWRVLEVDGHNLDQLNSAFESCPSNNKPTVIISHTSKGKGVSFTDGQVGSHNMRLTREEYEQAMAELI